MLTPERKQEIILANARHEGDTGSPEVQISYRTSERTQKRPSFPPWPAQNGRSAPWFIKLSYG